MITRYDGYGSFVKQYLKEGSTGGNMKVSPLHSHGQHSYSSGENLSPRSVLEQRALSGLAIAIYLEEKEKLSHPQKAVLLGRCLSKQKIWHMNTQETTPIEGKSLSREGLHHVNHGERETLSGGSNGVGLKVGTSVHHMRSTQGADEGLSVNRSGAGERINGEEGGISNLVSRMVAGGGGEREEGKVVSTLDMAVSSAGSDMAVNHVKSRRLPDAPPRSDGARRESAHWLDELGCVQQTWPPVRSAMEDSIFYCAPDLPSTVSYHEASSSSSAAAAQDDNGFPAHSHVEDFLKCCFLCKRDLRLGKDIYMYRGDKAFCSVECRSEQIVKDERVNTSAA